MDGIADASLVQGIWVLAGYLWSRVESILIYNRGLSGAGPTSRVQQAPPPCRGSSSRYNSIINSQSAVIAGLGFTLKKFINVGNILSQIQGLSGVDEIPDLR